MSTDVKIDAQTVKKLREETDAPMMECKAALVEAGGDFDKAKQLLREKGQAAAAKRSGRTTSEGLALVVATADSSKVAGVVVECETDFVARNDDFKALVKALAEGILSEANVSAGEFHELSGESVVGGKPLDQHAADAVAKIRENIRIPHAVAMAAGHGAKFAVYNHTNTGKLASFVEYTGDNADAAFHVAIQVVAFPPTFLKKEDVPQAVIDNELKIETQRAINDGKTADVAEKVALGRINKEYYQSQVLLEQPYYVDTKKKVADYTKESGIGIVAFRLLGVGSGEE
ncbi:MAG: translation elongation factor Ts [Fimbriimonadaceae bacterium]